MKSMGFSETSYLSIRFQTITFQHTVIIRFELQLGMPYGFCFTGSHLDSTDRSSVYVIKPDILIEIPLNFF